VSTRSTEKQIRRRSEEAVLNGLDRLNDLLRNPDTSDGDVLKGLTLLFDKIFVQPSAEGGDYEIRLRP